MITIRELKAEQKALADKVRASLAIEDLSDEQWAALEADQKRLDAISNDLIDAEERESRRRDMLAKLPSDPRESLVPGGRGGRVEAHHLVVKKDAWQDDPKCGYSSTREFLADVIKATTSGSVSPQLRFLAAAGSDEQSTVNDQYGGYLIPEGFMTDVKMVDPEADPTIGRYAEIPMTAPVIKIPARVDKNHTTSVSGGFTVAYGEETQSGTASRSAMERITMEAHTCKGLAYASEELLERSPISFAAYMDAGFRQEFTANRFKMKLRGTGSGQPLGILNAAATVSVAKESGQAADTINGTNLIKMRSRCWGYGNAIWLANHDTLPQLVACHIALTNGSVALFVPGNGTDVPDTLLGRPIYFTEFCETLGDAGDLVLTNWSQYLWGTLGQETRKAESVHVRFVENERTFKFIEYHDGRPWWTSALTPNKSTSTLSPFVTLAARA